MSVDSEGSDEEVSADEEVAEGAGTDTFGVSRPGGREPAAEGRENTTLAEGASPGRVVVGGCATASCRAQASLPSTGVPSRSEPGWRRASSLENANGAGGVVGVEDGDVAGGVGGAEGATVAGGASRSEALATV